MSPTVVKLGGSYAHYPKLVDIASALAEGGGCIVVVPGGGPFADRVRREQVRMGYDDATAHRMALLAMAAFGYALASLAPALIPCTGVLAIRKTLEKGGAPVWLPLDLLGGDPSVAESWDVTSDSLAVWLCRPLGARRLIFLKRGAVPRSMALRDLVATGALDPSVPSLLAAAGPDLEAWLLAPRGIEALRRALSPDCPAPGRRIHPV